MERIIECVPNFSEGRNMEVIDSIVNAIEKSGGVKILDVDPGEATNRTVVTFVGSPEAVVEAAFQGVKRAAELKADNAVIQTYAGTALSVQAQNIEDPAQKKALYEEAIKYYDKAKELDPDRLQSNWGYNRYNAYYNLYGADDPKTKQAEADSK